MDATHTRPRTLLRDTRGAAYTETVLMMPVLISIFAGIGVFHAAYRGRMDAAEDARRCVWEYANGGCTTPPPGCEAIVGGSSASPLSDPAVDGHARDANQALGDMSRIIPVPGLGGLLESILGTTTTARASRQIQMPAWLGGATRTESASETVVCNERPRELEDLIRDAFCAAVPGPAGSLFGCR
jgi:hypothetical protein